MTSDRKLPHVRMILAVVGALLTTLLAGAAGTVSQAPQEPAGEVVANLAAGRAVVLVAKDGIAVATAQAQIEPGTLPPLIVPVGSLRVAVLLGPVEWTWPGSGRQPLRLDVELRRSASGGGRAVNSKDYEVAATDIETVGLGFLDPLRRAAALLHAPLHLPPHDVFVEMLLAGYAPEYGPETWSLRYRAEQEWLRGDFYRTAVHRPEYVQLYPPEKAQPKTLMETFYPPNVSAEPSILDLLKSNDSRLAALRSADPGMGRAADLLVRGESQKIKIEDGVELLRAALQAITPHDARQMILKITVQDGMKWVLGEGELTPLSPEDRKQMESGAPTLRKKPSPQ